MHNIFKIYSNRKKLKSSRIHPNDQVSVVVRVCFIMYAHFSLSVSGWWSKGIGLRSSHQFKPAEKNRPMKKRLPKPRL